VVAVGLKAVPGDVTYLARHPRELGRALLSMNVIMPLAALAACGETQSVSRL